MRGSFCGENFEKAISLCSPSISCESDNDCKENEECFINISCTYNAIEVVEDHMGEDTAGSLGGAIIDVEDSEDDADDMYETEFESLFGEEYAPESSSVLRRLIGWVEIIIVIPFVAAIWLI